MIEIVRQQPDGSERRLPYIRLKDLIEGEAENPRLQAGDVVIVRQDPEALRQRELDNLRQQRQGIEHLGEDAEPVQRLDRLIEELEAGEANADTQDQFNVRRKQITQLLDALEMYRDKHEGRFPDGLAEVEPYLDEPVDLDRYYYRRLPDWAVNGAPPATMTLEGIPPSRLVGPRVLAEKGTFEPFERIFIGHASTSTTPARVREVSHGTSVTVDEKGIHVHAENQDVEDQQADWALRQQRMMHLLTALQAYRAQHNDRWPRELEDVEPYLSEPIDLERYHYTPQLAEMPAVDPRSTPRMPIVPVPDGSAPGEARLAPIVLQEKGTFARGDHVVQGRADGTVSGMGPLDVVITIDDDGVTIRRQNESTDEDARSDGGALQFRIVPTRETLHELGGIMGVEWPENADFDAMLADATTALEHPGAEATQRHDGPFAWFPVREELNLEGGEVITAEHEGRTHLLVANREPLVMRPVVDGERRWRLESASVGQDQQGRPSVAFALDEAGGEAMRRLSSENIGRPMAVLLDGEVLTAPTLQGTIARRGQITGSFSDEEIHQIVTQLRQGVVTEDAR